MAHLRPRFLVAGHQEITYLRLDPLYARLGRACAQVPMAVLPVAMRAERVAKEVEALPAGVLHRGLGLVEHQPKLRHHRPRPRQGLGRPTAAEDDEVIGIGGDVRPESCAASGEPPVLEEAVHVDDREQRACDPALRRAAWAAPATAHAPLPVTVPPLD